MVARVNRQILLKSRPEGAPSLDNFALKQGSVPEPSDGEVLMRTLWLSLDPYARQHYCKGSCGTAACVRASEPSLVAGSGPRPSVKASSSRRCPRNHPGRA